MAINHAHPSEESEQEFDLVAATETVCDLLRPHYLPADGTADADQMFSTAQLFALINDHSPELIPQNMIRKVLLGAGYKEGLEDGMGFVWYLKHNR